MANLGRSAFFAMHGRCMAIASRRMVTLTLAPARGCGARRVAAVAGSAGLAVAAAVTAGHGPEPAAALGVGPTITCARCGAQRDATLSEGIDALRSGKPIRCPCGGAMHVGTTGVRNRDFDGVRQDSILKCKCCGITRRAVKGDVFAAAKDGKLTCVGCGGTMKCA